MIEPANRNGATGDGRVRPSGVLSVAEATRADLGDLTELMGARSGAASAPDVKPSLPIEEMRERLEATLFGPKPVAEALIARSGHRTLGALIFSTALHSDAIAPTILVTNIFVVPEARRAGVGRAAMARLRRIARGRGAHDVELQMRGAQADLAAFCKAVGLRRGDRTLYKVTL